MKSTYQEGAETKSGLFYPNIYLKFPNIKVVACIFFSLYQVAGVLCTLEMEYLPTSKDISGYSKSLYFGDTDSYPALEKDATRKAKETGNSV